MIVFGLTINDVVIEIIIAISVAHIYICVAVFVLIVVVDVNNMWVQFFKAMV